MTTTTTSTVRALALTATGTVVAAALVGGTAGPAAGLPAPSAQTATTPSATPAPTSTAPSSPAASASATAAATSSPTPGGEPSECTVPAAVTVEPAVADAGRAVTVSVDATPGSVLRLFAHSAPSTSYLQVRETTLGADGRAVLRVFPPTTTSLYAQQVGCDPSETLVVGTRSSVSIGAVRRGVRSYTFSGGTLPRRPGQLVSLYRVTDTGALVLTSRTRTGADGRWSVSRTFLGSGRFGFLARTAQDDTNLAGSSAVRPTLVF